MYQRDPRSFAYDDQNNTYPTGHGSHNSDDYSATGFQQQGGGSDPYYGASQHPLGVIHDAANPSSPYYRSMTPSLAPSSRYSSSSRDSRYFNAQAFGGSSSSTPSPFSAQNHQYPSHYLPPSDPRSGSVGHSPQFIPTPSEIANSYANYSHPMTGSQSVPEDGFPPDYPLPPHMVPSSSGGGSRTSRLGSSRPRPGPASPSASSPTALSASGERFPCEKCGKTFSRSHDRKRHHETQHLATPIYHVCPYCSKEFSRNDSLKRHLDNGCDEMHS